jgi:hypothetical protein
VKDAGVPDQRVSNHALQTTARAAVESRPQVFMTETCAIEVMIRKAAPRSYKVTGGHFDYGSLYQASMAGESYVLPISQISEIQDLGNGRHIVVLPRWLARKSGLLKYERKL